MSFDYSKLRGLIVEKVGSQNNLAEKMGLSKQSLSAKVNNKVAFTQDEMCKIIHILNIPHRDISKYFFCLKS